MNVRILFHVLSIFAGLAMACPIASAGEDRMLLDQKIAAPRARTSAAPETAIGIFEKQFRIDTDETAATRRTDIERPVKLAVQAKVRLVLKFDLSDWPEQLRSRARIWVAVGAPDEITTEGPLGLAFSQNGVGMATDLNSTFNVDGVMVMGCDYAVSDGEITVGIDSRTHSREIDCTVHVIIYVSGKSDPAPSTAPSSTGGAGKVKGNP